MSRRAYGVSVSLDPALRVLLRPEGIGNLQIFSQGTGGNGIHQITPKAGDGAFGWFWVKYDCGRGLSVHLPEMDQFTRRELVLS